MLGGLHNLEGISAPAFNKYKIKNMQSDCELVSKKNDISFKWNIKFPINYVYEDDNLSTDGEREWESFYGVLFCGSTNNKLSFICIRIFLFLLKN